LADLTSSKKQIGFWSKALEETLIIGYFILLTVIFTRPLIQKISTHVIGSPGDNLYFIWQIGWFKQAIFDLKQLPFNSFLLNFPYGYNLATTEVAPLQLFFALPFAYFGQLVLGYNVSMLLTFVLAGVTMYHWIRHLTHSRMTALISASAYAFLPYHFAHFLIGHLNISAIQWFPLYFWGFTAILIEKGFSWKKVLLLASGLSGIALTSQYYLYFTLLISGIILLAYFLFMARNRFLDRDIWKQILLGGLVSLPALIVGVVPYLLVHLGGGSQRPLSDVITFSAGITDFLLPFTKHFLWGKWVGVHFPRDLWNEATLYLGIPVTVLSTIGFCQRKKINQNILFKIFLVGFLASLILAMGTNLTWMEQPVRLSCTSLLSGVFTNEDHLVILPGYLLFKYFPFYSVMRVWMRIGIFALMFNCAAAGMGINWLVSKIRSKYTPVISTGILLLVLLDFFVKPSGLSEIKPREVDLWLAQQPYGGQVQLPYKQSYEEYSLYYTLYSQKPLLGVIRTFPSNRFFELDPLLKNFPDAASVEALKKEGITYIVLDEKYYMVDEEFIRKCQDLGVSFEISLDGQTVLKLR
jgi:hypothetical protein